MGKCHEEGIVVIQQQRSFNDLLSSSLELQNVILESVYFLDWHSK
jgi:hypothetical protein